MSQSVIKRESVTITQIFNPSDLDFDIDYPIDERIGKSKLISFDFSRYGFGNSVTVCYNSLQNGLYSNGLRIFPIKDATHDIWVMFGMANNRFTFRIDSSKSTSDVLPNVHITGID